MLRTEMMGRGRKRKEKKRDNGNIMGKKARRCAAFMFIPVCVYYRSLAHPIVNWLQISAKPMVSCRKLEFNKAKVSMVPVQRIKTKQSKRSKYDTGPPTNVFYSCRFLLLLPSPFPRRLLPQQHILPPRTNQPI